MTESAAMAKNAPASRAGCAENERPVTLTVTCWHGP